MSKYRTIDIWDEFYGKRENVYDYAGRLMKKSAQGNLHSAYQPTIDHIRPLSDGGKDIKENIEICHYLTNEEKMDKFPHWEANGQRFHAKKTKGVSNKYTIVKER